MADVKHTTGREGWEDSPERYMDGILPPSKADRMIAKAEDGQVLPKATTYDRSMDKALVEDFLSHPNSASTGLEASRGLKK